MAKRTPTLEAAGTATRSRMRSPRQLPAFMAMTHAAIVAQLRSFANLFFGFLFPLAFVAVFGLIGNNANRITLGVVNGSDTSSPIYQALTSINSDKNSGLTLSTGSQDDLNTQLKAGNLDGVILITPVERTITVPVVPSPVTSPGASSTPGTTGSQATPTPSGGTGTPGSTTTTRTVQGYDIAMTISNASPQNAAVAEAFLQGVIDQVNLRVAGVTDPAVQLNPATPTVVEGHTGSYIDFALPGMLGFSLLSIAIFGTAFGFVVLKRTLVLKRIFATPTRPTTIVLAQGAARLFIAFLQVLVLLLAGIYLFNFHLSNGITTFVELMVVSLFGLVAFLGFGLVIAGNFRDENAMGPVVNLVTLPQFLLGGTFFPTNGFPDWVQAISNNLPLSYLNVALRDIASQGATLWDVRGPLLGVAAWGVVTYALAIKTFKWE